MCPVGGVCVCVKVRVHICATDGLCCAANNDHH